MTGPQIPTLPRGMSRSGDRIVLRSSLRWAVWGWVGVAACLGLAIALPIDAQNRIRRGVEGVEFEGVLVIALAFAVLGLIAVGLALRLTLPWGYLDSAGLHKRTWRQRDIPWSSVRDVELARPGAYWQVHVTTSDIERGKRRLIVPCNVLAASPAAVRDVIAHHQKAVGN